jgi:DNA-binding transcriptional ArsR family regulator
VTTTERRYDMLADAGPQGAEPGAPLDAVFDAVADARCRRLLERLVEYADGDGVETDVADLAADIGVDCLHHAVLPKLDDAAFLDYDAETVMEVYLSLYHTHVPKLSDAGLVASDQQRDLVALTDAGRGLEPAVRSLCSPTG